MADRQLESSALSAFCGSVATMLAAGIQTEEAALMLAENREHSRFQEVCSAIYESLVDGHTLSEAMEASEGFPPYAVNMVRTGEQSGHLETVLRNLEMYYDEEDRMFEKLRSTIRQPAALLVIMVAILAFAVFAILPAFRTAYENMAGSLAATPMVSVSASTIIGVIALAITVVLAIIALWLMVVSGSEGGRQRALKLFERLPGFKRAMFQLALSRFTASLATYISSGITNEEAMRRATETVDNPELRERLDKATESMIDLNAPRSLVQAISEFEVFEPLYARMLNVGMRSGSTEETLAQLSGTFFDDAILQMDRLLNLVEPAFSAFLTIAVGATLIAVMLPLVGIMGSIG